MQRFYGNAEKLRIPEEYIILNQICAAIFPDDQVNYQLIIPVKGINSRLNYQQVLCIFHSLIYRNGTGEELPKFLNIWSKYFTSIMEIRPRYHWRILGYCTNNSPVYQLRQYKQSKIIYIFYLGPRKLRSCTQDYLLLI